MALRVNLDGVPWLADVGFGGCVPTAPLRMDTPEPQATDHEPFRVFPFGDQTLVQAWTGDRWRSLYELSPETQYPADYQPANWYTATHPDSPFRNNLRVARTTPNARHALSNGRLTIRTRDGATEQRRLDAAGIEAALREHFRLPVEPDWRPVLERAAAAPA